MIGRCSHKLVRPGVMVEYDVVLRFPAAEECLHHVGQELKGHFADGRGQTCTLPAGGFVAYIEKSRGDMDTLVFVKMWNVGR